MAKSDVLGSNGNSGAIYARLGTMHHASRELAAAVRFGVNLSRAQRAGTHTHTHPLPSSLSLRLRCSSSEQFELCIGQYVVHPLNHDDLQLSLGRALSICPGSCIRNLRSFACHWD